MQMSAYIQIVRMRYALANWLGSLALQSDLNVNDRQLTNGYESL